jgi:exopolysaccharide biosynthesis polyprenyl glycosylphosphotransferase
MPNARGMLIKGPALEEREPNARDSGNQKPPVSTGLPQHAQRPRFARRSFRVGPRPAALDRGPLSAPGAEVTRPRRGDARLRHLLALADLSSAAAAIVFCATVLGDDTLHPGLVLVLPLVLVVSKVIGLYDRDEVVLTKSTLDELPALFQLAALYTLLVWLAEESMFDERGQIVGLWLTLFVTTSLARTLARAGARWVTLPERCLYIGSERSYRRLASKCVDNSHLNVELVGALIVASGTHTPPNELVRERLRTLTVDRVILALHAETEADSTLELISAIKASGCKVSLMPRMLEVVGSSVEFDDIDGIPVLGVRRFGLSRSSQSIKRTFDVVLSLALLIAVLPLMLAIAALVKLSTPGCVLFRQTRVGRDGSTFEMLKFRSMVAEAESLKPELMHLNEASGLFKIADDPRITRVGRWLRNSSLDELPQLINVLRGEMSLVGPRPLVAEDDRRIQGWYRRRLHLTPGMTGPWQVRGSSRIPLEEMVTIDYLYVANWQLWIDVKILLRTIGHVLGRNGC